MKKKTFGEFLYKIMMYLCMENIGAI